MKKPELPKDTDDHHFYLLPVYDHYKKVKIIDRCECCNKKTGEHFEERGVKIVGYKVGSVKKDLNYHLERRYAKRATGTIFEEPLLINRIKGKK